MKNREVLDFNNVVLNVRKELSGRVFTHALVLNRNKLEPFVKALEESRNPDKEMKEYQDKFEELKKEHATKDEGGNPILNEGKDPMSGQDSYFFHIPDFNNPHSEFVIKRNALYEEYKVAIDRFNTMIQEWAEVLLEEDSEFKATMIDLSDIPNEVNTEEMSGLIYMINE